ncbi:conserved hypothetical protein [Perkinsus marinus ATCC 50983]|uniref:Uncharacterized protein n=1 Tax=Perkinsus marinus (strain ATCC 50983 / TXsc) TaxID=423536 RepID=C5L2W3_PERM5|nr:conserved hypothetical protein [Perkinsus marinus ATCC 50983]EER08936.1 conserved hypothetical protein [Perkinsus marinus ATCC 50983]|eukprot:XP_002777120.1 conserved hypothetical protein [Perkinsus marinus ATCC 50983]
MEFPAYRDKRWITKIMKGFQMPDGVLDDTDITPDYLSKDPTAGFFTSKVANVKDQIKRALFRHCLFKIQNVEVQTLQKECEEKSRWLEGVRHLSDTDTNWVTWAATKKFTRRDKDPFTVLRKERWTIRRMRTISHSTSDDNDHFFDGYEYAAYQDYFDA